MPFLEINYDINSQPHHAKALLMASVNLRASGLWEAFSTMNHTAFDEEDVEQQELGLSGSVLDGRTPVGLLCSCSFWGSLTL